MHKSLLHLFISACCKHVFLNNTDTHVKEKTQDSELQAVLFVCVCVCSYPHQAGSVNFHVLQTSCHSVLSSFYCDMLLFISICKSFFCVCACVCVCRRERERLSAHVYCSPVQYEGVPNEAWICAAWLRATLVGSVMGGAWELKQNWGGYKCLIQTPPCGGFLQAKS